MTVAVAVPVPACGRAGRCVRRCSRISAAFRLKAGQRLFDPQAHPHQQQGQHRIGLQQQTIGLQLQRHMAVAQVIGGAQQLERRRAITERDDQHRLRRGHHPQQRAVFGQQHITTAHHLAARQHHAQLAALFIAGGEAAALAQVPVQRHHRRALDQHGGQAFALRQTSVNHQHGGAAIKRSKIKRENSAAPSATRSPVRSAGAGRRRAPRRFAGQWTFAASNCYAPCAAS